MTVVDLLPEHRGEPQMFDHRGKDLLRLDGLELVLDEIGIVVGAALRLKKLHLSLRFLDADLGRRQIPARQHRGDHQGRQQRQADDHVNQRPTQPQETHEVRERRTVLSIEKGAHEVWLVERRPRPASKPIHRRLVARGASPNVGCPMWPGHLARV